jgi:hypothetical protein
MKTPQEIKAEMNDLQESDFMDWKKYLELEKQLGEVEQ